MNNLPYNKTCCIEDFSNPEISNSIKDIFSFEIEKFPAEFSNGIPDSKQWETAMCVRALRNHNVLNRNSTVLGVGAGTEVLNFYLTKYAKQVFATDLYLDADVWSDVAPFFMLIDPKKYSPFEYDHDRLIVQDMDGRLLEYPDSTFDAIFSSGSIEHFGSLESISNAAYEMGRVLKSGGILSLSTEFRISGPSDKDGWDKSTLVLTRDQINKYIVEASGLELIDDIDTQISDTTMITQRNLEAFLEGTKQNNSWQNKLDNYPNLILVHQGFVFCSIHLTLRKTDSWPVTENRWAAPGMDIRKFVDKRRQNIISWYIKQKLTNQNNVPATNNFENSQFLNENDIYSIIHHFNHWQDLRLSADKTTNTNKVLKGSRFLSFIYRTAARIRKFGKFMDAESVVFELIIGTLRKTVTSITSLHQRISEQEDKIITLEHLIANQDKKLIELLQNKDEIINQKVISLKEHIDQLNNSFGQALEIINDKILLDQTISISYPSGVIIAKSVNVNVNDLPLKIVVDMDAHDIVSNPILAGTFEFPYHYKMLSDFAAQGSRVLDLGAHIGTFSLYAAKLGYQVVGVEASSRNAALLEQSMIENNFNNINIVNVAVSDNTGLIGFYDDGPYGHVAKQDENHLSVIKCMSVKDILKQVNWDSVDFIKMDVEGSEIAAIQGMKELLLKKNAPTIIFESNGISLNHYGYKPSDLMSLLAGSGYKLYLIRPGQLFEIDPNGVQISVIEDCIAIKNISFDPSLWKISPPFTTQETIGYFLGIMNHPNNDLRLHAARTLSYAPKEISEDVRIIEALNILQNDPSIEVREAVAWFIKPDNK